jgi:hypothetical protein
LPPVRTIVTVTYLLLPLFDRLMDARVLTGEVALERTALTSYSTAVAVTAAAAAAVAAVPAGTTASSPEALVAAAAAAARTELENSLENAAMDRVAALAKLVEEQRAQLAAARAQLQTHRTDAAALRAAAREGEQLAVHVSLIVYWVPCVLCCDV